jgi:hypothetical protein
VEAVTESGVGAIQNERKYSVVWWFNYRAIFPRKWLGCFTRQCLFSQVKLQFFLRSIPMHFIFLLMLLTNWINGIFQADILVRGYGGYNTRWALFLLHHLFPLVCHQITLRYNFQLFCGGYSFRFVFQESSKPPLATTIFFGANDASLSGRTSERQHVPIPEFKLNLQKIVLHLKVLMFCI